MYGGGQASEEPITRIQLETIRVATDRWPTKELQLASQSNKTSIPIRRIEFCIYSTGLDLFWEHSKTLKIIMIAYYKI